MASRGEMVARWHYPKRALDAVAAGAALLILSPLIAAVALAVRLRLGRPILFSQVRPGLNGRPFRLFKFRTMIEHRGPAPLSEDARRLTPFGKWLRSTSLDELPELWNVLKGDMSLVGPRPLLLHYLDHYTPFQMRRHEVRPGLTGWAQINGRNAIGWEEKFAFDRWYVEHQSLALDLRILAATVARVFSRHGINSGEAATMPVFRGADGPEGPGAPAEEERP